MGTSVAAAQAPIAARKRPVWLGLSIAVVIGAVLILLPTPQGLSRPAQAVLAITVFSVVLWMLQVMNNGIISILMMGLMIVAGIRPPVVLSGFASSGFWILLCVLFYGFAMQRTGLAQRISYMILSLFPGTYAGINSAFFVIGLVLAMGIPSMTVRTAIMAPIAWALVQSLQLPQKSRGSALIMLTSIEMAVVPGCAFLYGSLYGPVVDSLFQANHIPVSWLGYAAVLALPTLLFCASLIAANQVVLRPESPLKVSTAFARTELRKLGGLTRHELVTALIVVLSIVFWSTDRYHHMPSYLIGMLALAVFALAGIVSDKDVSSGVSWTLLLFLGGIFSLANVIQEYKVTDWIAGYIVPAAQHVTFSSVVFLLAVAAAMYLLKFLDPVAFIAIPVLFLSLVRLAGGAGIPPLVLVAPLLFGAVSFWFSYQNIWVAMGEGITAGNAFTASQRIRLANTYAVMSAIVLAVSVGYWKVIHVL